MCPYCHSAYLQVIHTGRVIAALVNVADPGSGIQAITVDTDTAMVEEVVDVRCASCGEPPDPRPRRHGSPAYRAAVDITEEAHWPKVWETADLFGSVEHTTRAARIVLEHDLARGAVRMVSTWEWLTGITDEERDRIRVNQG